VIPDIEKLLGAYLRNYDALADLGVRVIGTPGPGFDFDTAPWIRLTVLDAPSDSPADHHIGFYCQLDCYASKAGISGSQQKEASLVARTVREALRDIAGAHADGVVAGARINGFARIPDTDLEPARERIVLTTTTFAHAVPA
jgi:hypothetical protein